MEMILSQGMHLDTDVIGSITFTGFTCNLSVNNGVAFLTNPSVRLDGFVGRKLTLTAGGKTLVGWVKAPGSAETYDIELLTGWTNGNYDTFLSSGKNITSAIANTSTSEYALSNSSTVSSGQLYLIDYNQVVNSGSVTTLDLMFSGGWDITHFNLLSGSHQAYFTTSKSGAVTYLVGDDNNNLTTNHSLTISIKNVLTPSLYGVTIVSALNGATRNWTSNNGIDPNSTSFTLVVSLV